MAERSTDQERDFALARVIAIVNDKGGVGKTSIAANLGGQFAGAGYRCLLIDLNRQANLADDLGYRDSDADDQGAGLLNSVLAGTPLVPASDVRPKLDVVCGGARLEDLTPIMVSRLQHRGRRAFRVLGDVLAPIATDYEVVFIDCPPESTILSDLALAAARWVLMPTKSDVGGLVGMTLVAERFALAQEINPRLGLLGVVLFGTGTRSRAVHAEARAAIDRAFGGHSPRFETTIRHAERTAQDARRLGKLAHELELEAAAQPAWWETLRSDVRTPRVSATAASVAGDYRALGVEVLTALQAAEEAERTDSPDDTAAPDSTAAPA
ncbi:ParA family protein [Pseudonocardia cypriaca]|uniref:Cellulose biosynthesis protein BcsQ n=1 Tax=Pseudonocardia cypriaca TaxID=882449 RepID=A0A543FXC4_9PSEU|nr:ParA family protein [Pseudonocardia cypriaca]TQM38490.1 cellulose biosynthesis protein BcsQ [Pseudonocardia cypriaca]